MKPRDVELFKTNVAIMFKSITSLLASSATVTSSQIPGQLESKDPLVSGYVPKYGKSTIFKLEMQLVKNLQKIQNFISCVTIIIYGMPMFTILIFYATQHT